MRAAITLHRLHGEENFKVVTGPEVPIAEQLDAAKAIIRAGRENAGIAEIQVWSSSEGLRKRLKFRSPGETSRADGAKPKPAPKPKSKPAK